MTQRDTTEDEKFYTKTHGGDTEIHRDFPLFFSVTSVQLVFKGIFTSYTYHRK